MPARDLFLRLRSVACHSECPERRPSEQAPTTRSRARRRTPSAGDLCSGMLLTGGAAETKVWQAWVRGGIQDTLPDPPMNDKEARMKNYRSDRGARLQGSNSEFPFR
jgi:hypothetical protein